MPKYNWEGKARDGKYIKGVLSADSEQTAFSELNGKGIAITRLKEKKPFNLKDLTSLEINVGGIPPRDLMIFTRQFSTMLDSGLPLVQALDILGSTSENKFFGKILLDVKERVEQGATFSEALARHPKAFDDLFVNLVRAGEIGGILDTIMSRMATQIEKGMKINRRIKSAMTYPMIVLAVSIAAIGGLLFKVIPTFEDMFASMDSGLPALTQTIINMSRWAIAHGTIIFGGLFGFIGFVIISYRFPKGKYYWHKGLLKFPVIGDVIKKTAVARFTRTMGTLLSSGVPILDALEIVAKASGNMVIEEALMEVRMKISEGRNIVEPLAQTRIFPHMVVQMIGVGEQTGALDTMLNKIADFYEEEVDVAVENMTSMIEPLLMVFLGGAIGTVLIAMYMPVFSMAGKVQNTAK
ncbi:type II secretion system F family protein [Myxococcota bacterium]|nr:type II secretion system F family protein [Myxococcota bacterium]